MNLPAGTKDLRTTVTGLVTLVAGFVAFAPELFPETELWGLWVRKIAAFVVLVSGGAHVMWTPSTAKVKEKTAELIDQKISEKIGQ